MPKSKKEVEIILSEKDRKPANKEESYKRITNFWKNIGFSSNKSNGTLVDIIDGTIHDHNIINMDHDYRNNYFIAEKFKI